MLTDGHMENFRPEFERIAVRLMAMMALRDGLVRDAELEMIADVFERLSGIRLATAPLKEELDAAAADRLTVPDYLASVSHLLTETGKEVLLKAVFLISSSDGEFHRTETAFLLDIGRALRMPPGQMKRVIDELRAEGEGAHS